MSVILHVALDFTQLPDAGLDEFAMKIVTDLTGNPAFPAPPVALPALKALVTGFSTALANMAQGGPASTAAKNNARDALIAGLRQEAAYVQTNHGNDMATLLSSGFNAASTNRAQTPLDQPVISGITNGTSGQLLVTVGRDPNAACFEMRCAAIGAGGTPGPWQSGGLSTKSRNMPLNGLTPGTTYSIQVRAVGGSTGYSDWSDPVSHMSM